MKISLTSGDWNDYRIDDLPTEDQESYEVEEEMVARWRAATTAWDKMQDEVDAMLEAHYKAKETP